MRTNKFIRDFANLISQNYCYFCGQIEEIICHKCIKELIQEAKIQYLAEVPVLSMTLNNPTMSKLISSYKDHGEANLMVPFSKIISLGLKYFSKQQHITIVNVPSTAQALQKRGLDPITLLAISACKIAGKRFTHDPLLLQNNKHRNDQAGLNVAQRNINMKDSFKANYSLTKPVIIIDDLITTGSSLRASLAALRQQKINVKACVVMVSHH